MSDVNIFRAATEQEKMDFIEVGQVNILDVFMAKLADKAMEYQLKYKPFDKYAARIEFEEQIAKVKQNVSSSVDLNLVNSKIAIPDLDKYGDTERFELLGVTDVREDKLLDGIRNTVVTGKNYEYKAKARGNKITMFVPNSDLDKVEEKKEEKKEEVQAVSK